MYKKRVGGETPPTPSLAGEAEKGTLRVFPTPPEKDNRQEIVVLRQVEER